ncbi:olfactory receptor 52N5-like [Oncorhynchus mykiss]|uniref:olfactory receptor 52N5-like n=1 Tax=Oncorhynchus mykiss TaxID=8022 RepID=UPI001878A51E|nr:olfactory receptor 52N5-like [Oncorhynchus mykiss]
MENHTYPKNMFLLEGLKVTQQSSYPAFILLLIIYIFTMVSNIGLILLISVERSLHQPMYILFCNLPLNDALGATVIIPRLLSDIFVASADRYINNVACAIQAFCAHMFGTTSHTILIIMAFDRYVAICYPLRYATIMTNRMIAKLTFFAWGSAFLLVGILLGLTLSLSRCRSEIFNPFCDNASLFKLSCESVIINNIYGLTFTILLLGSSIGSVTLTYLKIAMVCVRNKNRVLNSRALQTCSTHLSVYIIMLVSGFIIIFLHRFPQWADHRKLSAILFHVVPPWLNPIIYGLQTKEIRQKIFNKFQNNKVTVR